MTPGLGAVSTISRGGIVGVPGGVSTAAGDAVGAGGSVAVGAAVGGWAVGDGVVEGVQAAITSKAASPT